MNVLLTLLRFGLHLCIIWGICRLVLLLLERPLRRWGDGLYVLLIRQKGMWSGRLTGSEKRYALYRHLDHLLYFANDAYRPGGSVMRFVCYSFLAAAAVGGSAWLTLRGLPSMLGGGGHLFAAVPPSSAEAAASDWRFPLFLALLALVIPYARLRLAYAGRRVKGSYDLLEAVKLSTKFTYLPVDGLLARTVELLAEGNVLRTPLRLLGAAFENYGSEQELYAETYRFASGIGTTFAMEFVSDLLYAEREGGHHLKHSLLLLNRSMEGQRETILAVKANSRDAISLGLYGNLVVLVASVGTFMYMLKPDVYFKLQFQTTVGLTFLMVILFGLFLSFLIGNALARPKLDYR